MAHPQDAEALDARPLDTTDDAAAALEDYFAREDGDEPDTDDEDSAKEDAPEGVDTEDDEQEDEDGEPETVIDAPVSLNAEEKAVFAQLPKEAQQAWAASETRRNAQVQEATTKAANAERVAKDRAASAQAEAKAAFAHQLHAVANAIAPQPPMPQLAEVDPGAYIAQDAHYRAAKAQHDDFMQQVAALSEEADTEGTQAFIAARDRELMNIPDVQNPETRVAFFDKAFAVAQALGIDRDDLLQNGEGQAFKALATAHDWKAKADKYDALMAKQMTRVREARSAKPNAAQPLGSGTRVTAAEKRFNARPSRESAAALIAQHLE